MSKNVPGLGAIMKINSLETVPFMLSSCYIEEIIYFYVNLLSLNTVVILWYIVHGLYYSSN